MNANCPPSLSSQPFNATRRLSAGPKLSQRQARMIEAVVSAACSMTPLAVALVLGVKSMVAA
jgi:hypothetical protein